MNPNDLTDQDGARPATNRIGQLDTLVTSAGVAGSASTSKAALTGKGKILDKELAGHNIAVNCITPASAQIRILEPVSEGFIESQHSASPRQRFATVKERATWPCSPENSFITAGVFDLSGGRAT